MAARQSGAISHDHTMSHPSTRARAPRRSTLHAPRPRRALKCVRHLHRRTPDRCVRVLDSRMPPRYRAARSSVNARDVRSVRRAAVACDALVWRPRRERLAAAAAPPRLHGLARVGLGLDVRDAVDGPELRDELLLAPVFGVLPGVKLVPRRQLRDHLEVAARPSDDAEDLGMRH